MPFEVHEDVPFFLRGTPDLEVGFAELSDHVRWQLSWRRGGESFDLLVKVLPVPRLLLLRFTAGVQFSDSRNTMQVGICQRMFTEVRLAKVRFLAASSRRALETKRFGSHGLWKKFLSPIALKKSGLSSVFGGFERKI